MVDLTDWTKSAACRRLVRQVAQPAAFTGRLGNLPHGRKHFYVPSARLAMYLRQNGQIREAVGISRLQ
jgi:hypothetical protein